MTDDLSKQLCELCGIEPKIDCAAPSWKRYECPEHTEKPLGIYDCNKCEFKGNGYEYPDFTKPENFVKLEEIMLKELAKERLSVVKWVYEFDGGLMHEYILITKLGHNFVFKHKGQNIDNWFVERKDRTECLILFILWKVMPICNENIKQAIKDTEWNYG